MKTITAVTIVLSFIFMIAGLSYMGASLAYAEPQELSEETKEKVEQLLKEAKMIKEARLVITETRVEAVVDHYANAFPSIKFYDDRQEKSRNQFLPEPIPYMKMWIDRLPREATCGTWLEVTGYVPYAGGVLISKVFKWYENDDGQRYSKQVQYTNLSYQTDYSLQNYVYVPCLGEGLYDFQFHYYSNPMIQYGDELFFGYSLGYGFFMDVQVREP